MITLLSRRDGAPERTDHAGRSRRSRRATLAVLASGVAAAALMSAGPAHAGWDENLSVTSPLVTGTGVPCTLGSGPKEATDGKWANIYTDKWCVLGGQARLLIRLHDPYSAPGLGFYRNFPVYKVIVRHAGIAGENPAYNTRAFRLRVSQDGINWINEATITDNTANETVIDVGQRGFYYGWVELIVDQATQPTGYGRRQAVRIYEVEVRGATCIWC